MAKFIRAIYFKKKNDELICDDGHAHSEKKPHD